MIESETPRSKSARKREATALQALGERLVGLRSDQLQRLPLDERLLGAVIEAQRIHARGGRRRQLQLIGKLMRSADAAAIGRAMDALATGDRAHTERLHALEDLRHRLLTGGPAALAEALSRHPELEPEPLARLVDAARQGVTGGRALFRYLRDRTPASPGGDEPSAPE